MKAVKKNNPAASCFLHYDKLYIDNRAYIFNDQQGKVMEYNQVVLGLTKLNINKPHKFKELETSDRPGSVAFDDRLSSALSPRSPTLSPTRAWKTSPLPLARTESLFLDSQDDDKQNRIIQLEDELIKQRAEAEMKMKELRETNRRLMEKLAQADGGKNQNDVNGGEILEDTENHIQPN